MVALFIPVPFTLSSRQVKVDQRRPLHRTSICSPLWRANSTIVASFKCARPPNTLMTFIHTTRLVGPVKSSVLCVILLSPRERELYIGEENRDEVPGQQQREQKSRIALWALSSIARVAEVLLRCRALRIVSILITFLTIRPSSRRSKREDICPNTLNFANLYKN